VDAQAQSKPIRSDLQYKEGCSPHSCLCLSKCSLLPSPCCGGGRVIGAADVFVFHQQKWEQFNTGKKRGEIGLQLQANCQSNPIN